MSNPNPQPVAVSGLIPTTTPDIPISAVFIFLFAVLAASHMTLFQVNNRRKHKFIFSALLFGFCMSRIVACIMRIVWATRPADSNIALVAQIFINAGILLVYVINNLLVQRLLRAALPSLGWNVWFRRAYKTFLFGVIPVIIMVIVTVVQSVKSTDVHTKTIDSWIQRAGLTYITVLAALPLVFLPLAVYGERRTEALDHFGTKPGDWWAKVGLLTVTVALACIEAGYRAGTAWEPARPITNPAWYHSKAAFYCFGFMLDVLILASFLVMRVDQRFHVPDGADGSYGVRREELAVMQAMETMEAEKGKTEEVRGDAESN